MGFYESIYREFFHQVLIRHILFNIRGRLIRVKQGSTAKLHVHLVKQACSDL